MRTIVHLSDIHFGRVDHTVIEPLIATVHQLTPAAVVVSGDLTQRARPHEFQEARSFLDRLPSPQIVVPGNHDVPLYNVFARFFRPLDDYRRYITADLAPFYADEQIAIAGVNTARSLTIKDGRISEEQIAHVRDRLCPLNHGITKFIVTHHPFDLPDGFGQDDLVGRAREAMITFAECGADVLLAGHLHISHTGHTAKRYRIAGHSALVVQAGTATSTRSRGETNSFNVLRVAHPHIRIERYAWDAARKQFAVISIENFTHSKDGWVRLPDGDVRQ
jgi:3',5'-cyclic AMP phosphodiesterase CpdA